MKRAILTLAIYVLVECLYLAIAQYVVGDLSTTPDKGAVVILNVMWFGVTTFLMEASEIRKHWVSLLLGER